MTLNEDNVACLNGNIRTRPDSNTKISLDERGGVVNAVTHEGNPQALALELLHLAGFFVRQHLGQDFLNAHLMGNSLSCFLIVARDHDGADTFGLKLGYCFCSICFERISNGDETYRPDR